MSGRAGPRVQLPLLDRLIDDAPDTPRDPVPPPAEAMLLLRESVRRDLEALLNARRRWRSWPAHMKRLAASPVGYGIPDFTAGAFNDPRRREELRVEIEDTIRRFEPRFLSASVSLIEQRDRLETILRLRITAVIHAEPAPEPVTFDTIVDPATDDVLVRPGVDI